MKKTGIGFPKQKQKILAPKITISLLHPPSLRRRHHSCAPFNHLLALFSHIYLSQRASNGAPSTALSRQADPIKDAIKLFDEMPKIGVEENMKALNILSTPDLDTYSAVFEKVLSGSSNSTYYVLSEIERKGVKPDAATFSVVMTGFYKEEKRVEKEPEPKPMEVSEKKQKKLQCL